MRRSGNVWDNSAMESFFSSLKTERTARKVYRSRSDAKADVFDYWALEASRLFLADCATSIGV
jgi:transposase InsO family protein